MKTYWVGQLSWLGVLWVGVLGGMQALCADPGKLFQQALLAEEAHQDLPQAIQGYQAVIQATESLQHIAAAALYRIGECHRKLGHTNEAVASYRRLLEQYAQQTNLVRLSRQNLVALGGELTASQEAARRPQGEVTEGQTAPDRSADSPDAGEAVVGPDPSIRQALAEAARIEVQVNEIMKHSVRTQIQLIKTLFPDPILDRLIASQIEAERALLQNRNQFGPTHPAVKGGLELYEDLTQKVHQQIQTVLEARLEYARILRLSAEAELGVASISPRGRATGLSAEESLALERVETLIRNSPDVLLVTDSSRTNHLAEAIQNGHLAVVTKLLQEGGVDVNGMIRGKSPLHLAAAQGNRSLCDLLLNQGAKMDALCREGFLPIHEATRLGFRNVIELFLHAGQDVDVGDGQGRTPLYTAIRSDRDDLVPWFLEKGADVEASALEDALPFLRMPQGPRSFEIKMPKTSPLQLAVIQGKPAVVQQLLAAGAECEGPPRSEWTPLSLACWTDKEPDFPLVEMLLRAGANPDRKTTGFEDPRVGFTPRRGTGSSNWFIAGRPQFPLEILIGRTWYGFSPWESDAPPIRDQMLSVAEAARGVKLLLDHGADANRIFSTPLVGRIFDPSAQTRDETPLTFAVALDVWEVVDLLLSRGIDWAVPRNGEVLDEIAIKLNSGRRLVRGTSFDPMMPPQAGGGVAIPAERATGLNPTEQEITDRHRWIQVRIQSYLELIEAGVKPIELRLQNETIPWESSMFLWAVRNGDRSLVQTLLELGVDPNLEFSGQVALPTALISAVSRGHLLAQLSTPSVAWLLDSNNPWRLYQWIQSMESSESTFESEESISKWRDSLYVEIIDLLLKAGADPNLTIVSSREGEMRPPGIGRPGVASARAFPPGRPGSLPVGQVRGSDGEIKWLPPLQLARALEFTEAEKRGRKKNFRIKRTGKDSTT